MAAVAVDSPGVYSEGSHDGEDIIFPCKGCGDILEEGVYTKYERDAASETCADLYISRFKGKAFELGRLSLYLHFRDPG